MKDGQLFPCACCGYLVLSEGTHDTYEICEICSWEDDPAQFTDPDLEGGANRPSLRQAQENFQKIGACDEDGRARARPPTDADARSPSWRPL